MGMTNKVISFFFIYNGAAVGITWSRVTTPCKLNHYRFWLHRPPPSLGHLFAKLLVTDALLVHLSKDMIQNCVTMRHMCHSLLVCTLTIQSLWQLYINNVDDGYVLVPLV